MSNANEWHRMPAGFDDQCPICACPSPGKKEHRAVAEHENLGCRWMARVKTGAGYRQIALGMPNEGVAQARANQRRKKHRRPNRAPVQDKTLQALGAIARYVVLGFTFSYAAKKLGVAPSTVWSYRSDHRRLWKAALAEAEAQVGSRAHYRAKLFQRVREIAAKKDVPADVEAYLSCVRVAERVAKKAEEPLFPADGRPRLTTFYKDWYVRMRLSDASPSTLTAFEGALTSWTRLTGDPAIEDITSPMLAKYRDSLMQLTATNRPGKLSPHTVKKQLRHIQTILDKAGPPGRRNRDAAGIIPGPVPWTKPPKTALKPPRIATLEQLSAIYRAAGTMTRPRDLPYRAAEWWKTLVVVAYNTGLRRRALFALRFSWIDWERCMVVVPAEAMKNFRSHTVHLNQTAMQHLLAVLSQNHEDLIFPWPLRSPQAFDRMFHRLQYTAGLARKEHVGLHNLRKTTGTQLWADSPQASQLALGHAGSAVTMRHYVLSDGIVAQALDRLPQPEGFRTISAEIAADGDEDLDGDAGDAAGRKPAKPR